MAYVTKYYAQIADDSSNIYEVQLQKKDYASTSIEITNYDLNPIAINYRGGRSDYEQGKTIFASSAEFTFYSKDGDDFTDILQSEYKDFKLVILKNESLFWEGWVNPENLTKSFVKDTYNLNLEATDGLLDLKDIDFPIAAASGSSKIITILKAALDETGIELDFEDQLNITESHISGSLLESIYANTNRFISNDDGVTRYLNCYDTLERLLSSFNCQLAQVNGKWTITAKHEKQSDRHSYDHDTLTGATVSNVDRTVDVSSYQVYFGSDEQSKIAPVKQSDITFQNRNLGESVVANGRFTDGTNGWVNGSGTTSSENFTFSANDNQLYILTREPFVYEDADGIHSFMSSTFLLEVVTTADTLTVSIDARVFNIEFLAGGSGVNPHIEICLKYPNGDIARNVWQSIGNIITDAYSGYEHSFDITQNGEYQVIFNIIPHETAPYEYVELLFDNILAIPTYGDDAEITFDNYYRLINTGNTAVQKTESTIYFADSSNTGDVGALRYSATGLTSSWSSHDGVITGTSLVELLGYYKLQDRNRFKDYLRISLKADSTVNFNSILQINSQYYSIISFHHDLRNLQLQLELAEFLTNDISGNYRFNEYVLNTVDGESSGGGSSSDTSALETQFNSFVAETNASITALEATTLQDVTTNGNSTTQGIVLKNTANTKEWALSVNTDGHLIISGGTNQNLHVSGDVIAFSSLAPAPSNWWSTAPLGYGLAYSGSSIVVTGGTGGGSIGAIGTINAVTKSSNGAVITGTTLFMQDATTSHPGLVNTGTQTFAGAKTFTHTLTVNTNSSIYGVFNHTVSGSAYANLKFNSLDFGYWGQASGLVTGGADTDFALRAQNNLIFSIEDVEKARLTSTGLVPGNNGSLTLGTSSAKWSNIFTSAVSDGTDTLLDSTGTNLRHGLGSSWTSQVFYIGGAEIARFDSSGLGVGIEPSYKIHSAKADDSAPHQVWTNTGGANNEYLALYNLTDEWLLISNKNGTGTAKTLHFGVGGGDTIATSSKMQITSSGYVGIGHGSSAPVEALDVNGNIRLSGSARKIAFGSNSGDYLGLQDVGTGSNLFELVQDNVTKLAVDGVTGMLSIGSISVDHAINVGDTSGSGNLIKIARGTGSVRFLMDNNANRLYLRATDNLILNDTGGNVGIGASPSFPLDVYSSANAPTVNIRTDQNFQAGIRVSRTVNTPTTWELYVPAGSTDIRLYNASFGDRFTFTNSGNFTATGEVTAYSDRRLKDNIETYAKGLNSVLALQPVLYNLKNDNSRKHIGVIAQDVQQIEPLLVEDTNGTLSVNYQKISVMLINAVKELSQQNEELLKRIEVLESNNTKKRRSKNENG